MASILASIVSEPSVKRFARVGLLGMAIDLLVFQVLIAAGASIEPSQITSFFAAAIFNFVLIARRALAQSKQFGDKLQWSVYSRFLMVCVLALLLRDAGLMLLIKSWNWQPQAAIWVAILITTGVLTVGTALFVIPRTDPDNTPAIAWSEVTISIIAYVLTLKLIFMGLVNLIPEEAYYWNYAQHLDWGYLDHPPMVAWLIWLSTSLLGKSEVSVRLPAYLCWIIAAVFMFRLTLNLYDRPAAFRTILLLAVLPIYFGLGFFMTPDAPLYAAWAGCLYFLERALLAQNRRAWFGIGLCVGLGMLSKYTIALLGLGTVMFLFIDRRSRRWLLRPEAYLAAILALILFSPVLFWNMRNNWVSFLFQGSNRWSGKHYFSLHLLIGWVLLLLTPMGLLGIVQVLLPKRFAAEAAHDQLSTRRRQHLWAVTFTLVPLSVFVIYSLLDKPKLNWTAPIWLAAIPLLAWHMVPRTDEITGSFARIGRRLWMPTIIALIFIHGGSFYYISLGLPGAGPMSPERLFGEWRQLSDRVEKIERVLEDKTGSEPIIVGMDKNFISSELSFYDSAHDRPENTGGSHFFGGQSLMWAFWSPRSAAVGRNFLMIDFSRDRLTNPSLSGYFASTSEVFTEALEKDGRVIGNFYWRIGYVYRG